MQSKIYDVALSFAGENRKYVHEVAELLKENNINVFYDDFEKHNLWGKNLYEYLSDIYKNKAKYTIIFISEEYAKKLWTNHERESAQARAFLERKEYILPAKFDDTEIIGIHETIGYIDLRYHNPKEFVEIIIKKITKTDNVKLKSFPNNKTYICPFCKSKVKEGSKFCLGCKAEVVYGSTKDERRDNFLLGAIIGGILSFVVFIILTSKVKDLYHINFYNYVSPMIALTISIGLIIFSGTKFMKKYHNKRLKEAPRFFQKNMIG